ncbi:MAG: hypothetical protein PWR10_754 [Halanaerobiales bacterium]|nr:hypothetical protein [Halanaerobiales bacterium]
MSEKDTISRSKYPVTKKVLVEDLKRITYSKNGRR